MSRLYRRSSDTCSTSSTEASVSPARISSTCLSSRPLRASTSTRSAAGPVSYTHLTLPTICSV
eukprot:3939179-Rhodomonas_salina.3